ncbi:MAG: sigma-70 family RNA polymerase sigma factor [Pyrinomonadaceae bacterium]|nr:sigma-70 family RNA polymerase sigma factor [Pyrinomonadaceae bacterium]
MEAEGTAKRRWELTEAAFDKLLAALSEDRDEAGDKYLLLCRNLLRYFEVRGIAGAETAADEVINRLAKKLESGEQLENVNTYALGIARLLTLELRRSPEQKTSNELPEISNPPVEENEDGIDNEVSCLNDCLEKLSKGKKEIIVGYYQGERRKKIENRRKIAEKLGIPQNALRNRVVRMRRKLEACIKKCIQINEGW